MTAKASIRYVLNKKAIQHYLIDHDLTQGDFAKMLYISAPYFSKMLNGRKSISLSILFSIAEKMSIDPRNLIVEVDE